MLLSGHSPGFGEEGDVQMGGGRTEPFSWETPGCGGWMRKLKPMRRRPGPGPQEQVMVQTGPGPLPRSSPARASALCSQSQGELGALENLASVLPNTPDSHW